MRTATLIKQWSFIPRIQVGARSISRVGRHLIYPRLHLLPNGKVFYSGSGTSSALFDPIAHTWQTNVANTNYAGVRTYGTSVLLPLTPQNGYTPKVMIMGGGNPATNTTEIINLSAATPAWAYSTPMSEARIEMNAVLLPTGTVLAVGGSVNDEDSSTASLAADLFDPVAQTMKSAGSESYARLYHSVSLLLPDATVWVAGGNARRSKHFLGGVDTERLGYPCLQHGPEDGGALVHRRLRRAYC